MKWQNYLIWDVKSLVVSYKEAAVCEVSQCPLSKECVPGCKRKSVWPKDYHLQLLNLAIWVIFITIGAQLWLSFAQLEMKPAHSHFSFNLNNFEVFKNTKKTSLNKPMTHLVQCPLSYNGSLTDAGKQERKASPYPAGTKSMQIWLGRVVISACTTLLPA